MSTITDPGDVPSPGPAAAVGRDGKGTDTSITTVVRAGAGETSGTAAAPATTRRPSGGGLRAEQVER